MFSASISRHLSSRLVWHLFSDADPIYNRFPQPEPGLISQPLTSRALLLPPGLLVPVHVPSLPPSFHNHLPMGEIGRKHFSAFRQWRNPSEGLWTLTWTCKLEARRRRAVDLLKPVLNWANVCSQNRLRTVRRTMIRFLIELLVRWTSFGQFDELYFVLSWLVMRCKLRPELVAADAQQTAWSKM